MSKHMRSLVSSVTEDLHHAGFIRPLVVRPAAHPVMMLHVTRFIPTE